MLAVEVISGAAGGGRGEGRVGEGHVVAGDHDVIDRRRRYLVDRARAVVVVAIGQGIAAAVPTEAQALDPQVVGVDADAALDDRGMAAVGLVDDVLAFRAGGRQHDAAKGASGVS